MDSMDNTPPRDNRTIAGSILIAALIIGAAVYLKKPPAPAPDTGLSGDGAGQRQTAALPLAPVTLPVVLGDIGARLVSVGVIDKAKFEELYRARGGLSEEEKRFLYGENPEKLVLTSSNASFLLNLFWALGLGQKSSVLENGPISDPRYGGAGGFASTGGWTVGRGDVMSHFSKHRFFALTGDQEALVAKVAKGVFRPCCNNSAYFPDCNHGMAMLGLLELAASQGASEEELWKTALAANRFWFPDAYQTIENTLRLAGRDPAAVPPKELVGAAFVSASGYRRIIEEGAGSAGTGGGGGGCSV